MSETFIYNTTTSNEAIDYAKIIDGALAKGKTEIFFYALTEEAAEKVQAELINAGYASCITKSYPAKPIFDNHQKTVLHNGYKVMILINQEA